MDEVRLGDNVKIKLIWSSDDPCEGPIDDSIQINIHEEILEAKVIKINGSEIHVDCGGEIISVCLDDLIL